jgi:hypothetical protein
MKIGIGADDQQRQLSALGCERVYTVPELTKGPHDSADPIKLIFRDVDTILMVQPGILPKPMMRAIAEIGPAWQVPGHDPARLMTEDARAEWRRQKPRDMDIPIVADVQGRPPKWPVPTGAQVAEIVRHWHGPKKPAVILEIVQAMMAAPVPKHWVRDQVIKATGSAKRSPQGEPKA